MKDNLKLYEEHKERLIRYHEDLLKTSLLIMADGASEDKTRRELIKEVTELSNYIGSCINIIEWKIKNLKKDESKNEKA